MAVTRRPSGSIARVCTVCRRRYEPRVGICSIALLRTFIKVGNLGSSRAGFTETGVMWQVLIHLTFVVSAIGSAFADKLSDSGVRHHAE